MGKVFFLAACLFFIGLQGCKPQGQSDTKFGLFDLDPETYAQQSSLLPLILKNKGHVTISVWYQDGFPSGSKSALERRALLERSLRGSLVKWLEPLNGVKGWDLKTKDLRVDIKYEKIHSCTFDTHDGMGIMWVCEGTQEIGVLIDEDITRSYAQHEKQMIFISGKTMTPQVGEEEFESTLLHEFGHLMGLADTYVEEGYQNPVNQPNSIMRRGTRDPFLKEDDKAGIRQIWSYLNSNARKGWLSKYEWRGPIPGNRCGEGYKKEEVTVNRFNVHFCLRVIKKGEPVKVSLAENQGDRFQYFIYDHKGKGVRIRTMGNVPTVIEVFYGAFRDVLVEKSDYFSGSVNATITANLAKGRHLIGVRSKRKSKASFKLEVIDFLVGSCLKDKPLGPRGHWPCHQQKSVEKCEALKAKGCYWKKEG